MKDLSVVDTFTCTGCDETYPVEFRFVYHAQELCPSCAKFWADYSLRKLRESERRDAERAGDRIADLYRRIGSAA
jgi:hypothetical protein